MNPRGRGYHWFVAIRYLRGARHGWSRILVANTAYLLVICATCAVAYGWMFEDLPRPRGNGAQWRVDPLVAAAWCSGMIAAGMVWMVGRFLKRGRLPFAVLAVGLAILPPIVPTLPVYLLLFPAAVAAVGAWLPTTAGTGRRWFARVVTLLFFIIVAAVVQPSLLGLELFMRLPLMAQLIILNIVLRVVFAIPGIVALIAWWDALARPNARDILIAVGMTIAAAMLVIVLAGAIIHAVADEAGFGAAVIPSEMVARFLRLVKLILILNIVVGAFFLGLTILRRKFSFFSTVSIAGVWIGTMALVIVLSVMSGFESDLRSKILGSNAHIQVSRDKGDFVEWEDVKRRVEKVPGVVASTPFAVSEVVIAASNNYFNVIIKGIDTSSIEKVNKLMDAIECNDERGRPRKCTKFEARAVLAKLDPVVDDEDDRVVPQDDAGSGAGSGGVVDEAPADMVDGADPIDFSGAEAPSPSPPPPDRPTPPLPPPLPEHYGGDAPDLLGLDAPPALPPREDPDEPIDDPEGDEREIDEPPTRGIDLGLRRERNPDGSHTITVSQTDLGPPTRRTLSLPGVLVGRELTKQIHLWEDQEVRMVSPLSDPANPDATGTPIPFNRDYRVAGMFFTGMYEYDLKFVYVTLESLQDFLDRGDAIDGLEVRITDPDATDDVVAALRRELGPEYRVQGWQELNRSLFSALSLEKIMMFVVLGIIILVASFSIIGTLVMVVVEKGKEIALLKTLGSSDRGAIWIFVTQGLFIGLIGSLLGVAYGLGCCLLMQTMGIPIDADVYYIDQLPLHVDLGSVAMIAAAGVIISVGATIYPAFMASRLPPSVGLRH